MATPVSSSTSPDDNTEGISIPEHKETSPVSSDLETKATNKKRRLEEDIPTELGFGEATAGTSMGASVTSTLQSRPSLGDQGQESTLHPQKKRRLDDESSAFDASDEVGDRTDLDTGDSSISSIVVATRTTTSTPTSSLTAPPTLHATSPQLSAPAVDPSAESSSRVTVPDAVLHSLSLLETQIEEEKDANTRPSKKARLSVGPTVTNSIPTSSSTLESAGPLAATISDANTTLQIDAFPKPSLLVVLPVELLSDVLIYTGSPQHVLAVARTCKALCQTLLNPNNQFIWREARRAFSFNLATAPVFLPDPPKDFFGEAAYAAFVFDSGVCEACGNETSVMYTSFAVRGRLCKGLQCRNSAVTSFGLTRVSPKDLFIAEVVPVVESNACLVGVHDEDDLIFFNFEANFTTRHCRAADWQKAKAWIENSPRDEAFSKKYEEARQRQVKWMEFAVPLQKWKVARQAQYYVIRDFNESQSKNFASKFGWNRKDMNTTVYGLYHQQKNKVMEKVKEADVRVMIDKIESQLLTLSERRARHAAEVAYLKNRSDIEKLYHTIQSNKTYPFLPSLPTFRQLPVISLLQSAPTTEGMTITQTLQSNPLMRGLLSEAIKQWVETAKDDFAVLLGFPKKWKNASTNVLHPVERATAKFLCIRCGVKVKESRTRADNGCLDFVAACKHVCSDKQGNPIKGKPIKGKKGRWDVSNFVKDEKAINALKKVIQTLNYSEDKAAAHAMITLGLAVLCTSCDPPMVLDTRNVVGHCHRHDAMEISLTFSVDSIISYLGGYPFSFGLVEKLRGSERLTFQGKKAIESKNYGCRHCLRAKQVELTAAAAAPVENRGNDSSAEEAGARNPEPREAVQVKLSTIAFRMHERGIEGPKEKPPPLFNFNGMISHLKAKHHIGAIRDEDFLCYEEIDL